MLYATEGVDETSDLNKAMVGVASVWYVLVSQYMHCSIDDES
jgi:hypothetical protein